MWPATALVAAALLAVLLVRPWSGEQAAGRPAGGDAGAGTAAGNRAAAAAVRWAATELDPDTSVAVPEEALLDALVAAGGDADRFGGSAAEAAEGLRMVTGRPPEGALVLARFPDPDGTLTLVDLRPGQPTPEEVQRRQRLARAVLANPSTGATGRAAEVLERGHLDARLLGLVAALATRLEAGVADLPPAPGEPEGQELPDAPLVRTVLVDRVGGSPVPADRAATERLVTFLDAQLPPYAPSTVEVTEEGVRIAFRYASAPDALVTAQTP
jgi:hypothetical protein